MIKTLLLHEQAKLLLVTSSKNNIELQQEMESQLTRQMMKTQPHEYQQQQRAQRTCWRMSAGMLQKTAN